MPDRLRATADNLIAEVHELTEAITRLKWINQVIAALAILALVTSGAVAYVVYEQHRTRVFALCPLYSVLVGSYAPQTRAAGPDREAYEEVFVTMRRAYAFLDCPQAPVAPRLSARTSVK